MELSTVVINVAYISLFASTFMRTVPRLRMFLVAAAICFIVFGSMVGNWSMVAWNVLTGLMNSRQLVIHAQQRRAMVLSAEDESFRNRWFGDLDAFDFASLWSMGEDVSMCDERIVHAGQHHASTSLILDGGIEVRRHGTTVQLGPGALIGEMSLVSGDLATADVDAVGPVRLRQWSDQRLHTLDALNPKAGRAFHRFVEQDLTVKVLDTTDRGTPDR
ncbi:MAG: cyclic nucleotide-binding domain-containing protein [Ilumatobacter sp.]